MQPMDSLEPGSGAFGAALAAAESASVTPSRRIGRSFSHVSFCTLLQHHLQSHGMAHGFAASAQSQGQTGCTNRLQAEALHLSREEL